MLELFKSKVMIGFVVFILGITYIHSINEVKMNEQNQDPVIEYNHNI